MVRSRAFSFDEVEDVDSKTVLWDVVRTGNIDGKV